MRRSIFENNSVTQALQNIGDGSVSQPPIKFDDDSGIFQAADGQINFAIGGEQKATIKSTAVESTVPQRTQAGSAAAPSFSFTADTNTGIYSSAADALNFSTNGTNRLSVGTSGITTTLPLLAPDGTIANPSYSFSSDSSTGMNLMAMNTIGLSTGGENRLTMTNLSNQFYNPVTIGRGSVSDAYLTINTSDRTYRSSHNSGTTNQALQIGPTSGSATSFLGVDHNPGFSDVSCNFNMLNSGGQIIRTAYITGNSSTYSSTTANSETGNMRFYVKPANLTAVEVLRLKNSTTTDAAAYFRDGTSSTPGISFMSNAATGIYLAGGQIAFAIAGTTCLVLNGTYAIPNNDGTASLGLSNYRWTTVYAQNGTINTSDANLKTAIESTPLGLDFVKGLNPVRYKWAEVKDQDGKITQSAGSRYHYGLIAQEVKTLLDNLSIPTSDAAFFTDSSITEDTTKPARYGLNYGEFTSILIKSIQELSGDVAALTARVQHLESLVPGV
jgi:hypothetical protein